jgi:hypothetical protein
MHTLLLRLVCLVAVLAGTSLQAVAQNPFILAQQVAPLPKRALPLPDKPVREDENARALRLNNWTIGLAGGLLEGTFAWYAADLGNVLDLVYVKGIDFAITYADVLDHYKNVDRVPGIEQRVNYVIPMFQGEFHLFVRPEIKSIQDLAGKKVGFNTVGSAANYTGNIVFERLGVKVEKVFMNNSLALEAMRKGELAGLVHAVGKPNSLFKPLKAEEGFRFLPVEYTDVFKDYYTPAELTHADYPNLIPQGQSVPTISVQALLAVYNWPRNTDRYRRCVRFVEYLFERFDKLRQPPYQPGWRQINLAGTIPGWTRFQPAQEMLDKIAARPKIDPSLARSQAARAAPNDPAEQERLFQQFLEWSKRQSRR